MLPIKDINRSLTTPHVTRLLLLSNIAVFIIYWLSSERILVGSQYEAFLGGNFVMFPNDIIHGQRLYTLFTSMFMHASIFHLFGNMLYLFIFGDNIEDIFGHVGYIAFYLITGLVASFAQIFSLANPADLNVGIVGASGAISGILGAYLVLFPKAKILTIVLLILLPIPAILFLGFWFLLQWFYVIFDLSGGVAYFAHIGGFIAGMVLALVFGLRRKKARTLQPRVPS